MRSRSLLLVLLVALAGPVAAQDVDPDEEPAMAESHPLPDGVPAGNPDDQLEGSQSPDADLAHAANPDSITVGPGQEIDAHSVNPDAITTTSQDLTDLPQASVLDAQVPAAIPAATPLPVGCGQPTGDAGWSACLGAVSQQLSAARERLAAANAAYSRSITMHVPTGAARAEIIQERDAAQAEVQRYSAMLASQVQGAQQAGASSSVTDPYAPRAQGF